MSSNRHFGVGLESTYGTPVAPTRFFDVVNESLTRQQNDEEIKTIRTYSTRKYVTLTEWNGGDAEIIANYQDLTILFYGFYGSTDKTGTTPKTHTFPASTGLGIPRPSLTAEVRRDTATQTWRYAGQKVVAFGFTGAVDSVPRMTWGFKGTTEGTGTAATASYQDFDVMLPSHITVSFDGTALDATSVNINAAFSVDDPFVLGSTTFGKEPEETDNLSVSGDVTVLFDSMTQYNKFDGATDIDVSIAITDGANSLTFNLDKTRLTAATPNVSMRERLTATYNFTSYYNTDATECLQTILVNDEDFTP